MNPVKLIAAFAVLAMLGWGCHSTDSGSAPEGITFQTTQSNYALGDTVRAVLQNKTSGSIEYGNPFQVQQKRNGEWNSIGPNGFFTLEAILLAPGNTTAYRFTLADSSDLFPKHSFSEAQYRVTTNIGVQDENPSLETPPFHISTPGQPEGCRYLTSKASLFR